jgi:hypothetical protein
MDLGSSNMSSLKRMFPIMISLAIVMIGIMVFFSIINFDLLPIKTSKIEKIVEIEAFDTMGPGFCKSHEGNTSKLQDSCSELLKDNCVATSCCVYAKIEGEEKCHAGDKNGPIFRRDNNGKTKDIDYYYFKNKCYGVGCKDV